MFEAVRKNCVTNKISDAPYVAYSLQVLDFISSPGRHNDNEVG